MRSAQRENGSEFVVSLLLPRIQMTNMYKSALVSSLLFVTVFSQDSTHTSASSNVKLFGVLFSNGTLTKIVDKPELTQELEAVCSSTSKDTKTRTTCIYALEQGGCASYIIFPQD